MSRESGVKRLEGRVAGILNARELVINIGSNHGVKEGIEFAVMAETPTKIVDPTTKEVLDTIDREKVRVQAKEVRPKVTICRTYRMKGGVGGFLRATQLSVLSQMMAQSATHETLRIEDSDMPAPLPEEESYVKINDRVVEVRE